MDPLPSAAQAVKPSRRRRGKIARLPRKNRERINQMLNDGMSYGEIIAALGEDGKHLNEDNFTSWFAGGYQDWLKDQPWLERLQANLDFAANVLEDEDSPKIREASLVVAIKQMYELIKSFEPEEFKDRLADDPATYSRILNSLAKLAEVGLRYDRERGEVSRASAREVSKSKKSAGLTDDLLRQYENEFNLLRRPAEPNPESQIRSQSTLTEVAKPATDEIPEVTRAQSSSTEVIRG